MNKAAEIVKVGIADLSIVNSETVIRTSGLGSCVGVVLYESTSKIAGMIHIMLPDSSLGKQGVVNRRKYADTAIDELVNRLVQHGARKSLLRAKIAGGAQMFQFSKANDMMRIGPRNVEAVKKKLREHDIPICSEDVGGTNGRTIEFHPATGQLHIRTVNKGESVI
ncbi:chemotaxis protein CheD [Halobacillus naozhouensis]|uniref:Probable chemoreceptor glutamine deamidase CheD n=1 Tax=Halobacillus naozhouensis TaxID=554880 RepID=A0ABY8J389_9BACI|nr:chemotaxis protein CheD [Halobacillus naozhouensis]WFT76953.1 chemotaxis protein CheD [Halobacillus naozhouensis]